MYGSKWDEAGIQMLGRSILDGVTGDGSLKFKALRIYDTARDETAYRRLFVFLTATRSTAFGSWQDCREKAWQAIDIRKARRKQKMREAGRPGGDEGNSDRLGKRGTAVNDLRQLLPLLNPWHSPRVPGGLAVAWTQSSESRPRVSGDGWDSDTLYKIVVSHYQKPNNFSVWRTVVLFLLRCVTVNAWTWPMIREMERTLRTGRIPHGYSQVNVPTLQSARHAAPYATAQHHTHTIIHTLVHPSWSLTRHEARRTPHKKQRGRERGRAQWVRTVVRNGTTGQEETKAKTNQPTHPQAAAVQHPSYTPLRPPPADAYLSDKSYRAAGQLKVNFKRACSVPPPATAATGPPPSPSPSLPPPSPSPPRCLPTNNVNDVDDVPAPSWRTHIPSLIVDYGHAYL
ncbi:uncharacterized protein CCOS01_02665 [Colletotrichum costaricense]|uniref:Uncharacterized protein n=1 Tax=Colletotrichum costaricense TaxID=1209916 RepID=A0AAI9Z8E0_9PEZI|nr:uncharacterized protein CCOS01_02665 [Colletotrichum costaricense]KAK1537345.1 hypothetical protein CCOS01_02665 [Colletotrichum costaricense]